jgi:inward rectifier potassium channel
MFSRFSRPTARILFSRVAVIARRNGLPCLMFRMANERANMIVEANIRATVLLSEKTAEGETLRRLHDLALLRSSTPTFSLTFTAIHSIDEKSPLHGLDAAGLAERQAQIFVSIVGLDESFSQTVHARTVYDPSSVRFGSRFVDILQTMRDGGNVVDYTRFHDVTADGPPEILVPTA